MSLTTQYLVLVFAYLDPGPVFFRSQISLLLFAQFRAPVDCPGCIHIILLLAREGLLPLPVNNGSQVLARTIILGVAPLVSQIKLPRVLQRVGVGPAISARSLAHAFSQNKKSSHFMSSILYVYLAVFKFFQKNKTHSFLLFLRLSEVFYLPVRRIT